MRLSRKVNLENSLINSCSDQTSLSTLKLLYSKIDIDPGIVKRKLKIKIISRFTNYEIAYLCLNHMYPL